MSQVATPGLEVSRDSGSRWQQLSLVLGAVLVLAHLPALLFHFRNLWAREHYQYFPLVIAGVVLLALPVIQSIRTTGPSPQAQKVALGLIVLDWLLLASSAILQSPILGAVAFWVLLVAATLAFGGWPALRVGWKALAFYWLLIPPPLGLDEKIILFLQKITSRFSSRVLDLVPIYHVLNGVIVEVAGKKFEVERACSGISSLLSILACTVFYILYTKTHWLRGLLLILAAIFWVLINNITRVVTIVLFHSKLEVDLTSEPMHTILGFVLFGLTLGLLWSTDRLLMVFGSDRSALRVGPRSPVQLKTYPLWQPTRSAAMPLLGAFGLLALFQLVEVAMALPEASMTELTAYYNAFNADTMPEEIGGWKQVKKQFNARDDENPLVPQGAHSRTWMYQNGGYRALLSFDYAFPFWHDLRYCYQLTGWDVGAPEGDSEFKLPLGQVGDIDCVRFTMRRPIDMRYGFGWFGEFDPNGKPVPISEMPLGRGQKLKDHLNEVRDRWLSLVGLRPKPQPKRFEILQVQCLAEYLFNLNDSEKQEHEKFFAQGISLIRDRVVKGLQPRSP